MMALTQKKNNRVDCTMISCYDRMKIKIFVRDLTTICCSNTQTFTFDMTDNHSFEIDFDFGASCLSSTGSREDNDTTNVHIHPSEDTEPLSAATAPAVIVIDDSDDSSVTDDGEPSSSGNPVIKFGRKRLPACKSIECNRGTRAGNNICTCKASSQQNSEVVIVKDEAIEPVVQEVQTEAHRSTSESEIDKLKGEVRTLKALGGTMYETTRVMKLREERT